MIRTKHLIAAVLGIAVVAHAEDDYTLTFEQAQKRLAERQAARTAALAQPANITESALVALQKELAALKVENARLIKELSQASHTIETLRAELTVKKPAIKLQSEKLTQSGTLSIFDVADGKLAISLASPIFYLPKSGTATYYDAVYHAFAKGRKVHRDKEGFYPVGDNAEEIKISSSDPDTATIDRKPSLGIGHILSFNKQGTANLKIEFATKVFLIEIRAVAIDINLGDDGADVVRKLGLPEKERRVYVRWPNTEQYDNIIYNPSASQSSISAQHWQYNKYPYLVISIVNGKVHRISSSHEGKSREFAEWMVGMIRG